MWSPFISFSMPVYPGASPSQQSVLRSSGRSHARREAGVSRVRDDGSEAKRIRFLYQIRGCDNGGNDNVEPGHPDRCERFACGLRHGRARDAFASCAGAPAGRVRFTAAPSGVLDVCVRIGRDLPRRGAACFCCSLVSPGQCDRFGRGSTHEQGGVACGASWTGWCLWWCLTRRHEGPDLRRTRAGVVVAGARCGPHP